LSRDGDMLDVSGRLNAALVDARLPGFVVENNAGSELIQVAQQVLDGLGWPNEGSTAMPAP
jgi:hypothetical protein